MRRLLLGYWAQIFDVKLPEKVAMQEIYAEITSSLTKAYQYPEAKHFLASLPVESLMGKSVEYYVGSRSTPRNESIMKALMEQAAKNAEQQQDPKLVSLVKYYYTFYVKLGAIRDGNRHEYDRASDKFMELAEKGHELSNYLVGKQIYKMVEAGEMGSWKEASIVNKSREVFYNSICVQQFGGMFYIADIDEKINEGNPTDEEHQRMLFELYCQSASLGYALSYFKIALKYKQVGNWKMYRKYLLLASESGIVEAQHNLAMEYLSGEHLPKDEVRAIAWFMQAGAHGFIYSKYNLSKIFEKGSSCGRLKPNLKASLVYMEQIARTGELDVAKELQDLVAKLASL